MRKVLAAIFVFVAFAAHAQSINPPPTVTTFNSLLGSTGGTITGFGTTTGQALGPLVNIGASGHGLLIAAPNRLILEQTPGTAADFAILQVLRATTFSGGSLANISQALIVQTTVGASDATNEFNLVGNCTSISTVSANCIGVAGQGVRSAGNSEVWGGIFGARDSTDQVSSAGRGVVGSEIDFGANLADDANNGAMIGGHGIRVGADVVLYRATVGDTGQTQGAIGLWFTTSTITGSPIPDTHTNYGSMVGAGVNTQAYSMLDARGVIAPTGSGNPVFALNMDGGQAIEFKGDDSTLSPNAARTLLYTSGLLSYQVSGTTKFSVSDTGAVNATSIYGSIRTISGTTDTLAATDCGNSVEYTSASAVTVTVPNSLPIGCQVALAQYGAGKVSTTAGASATQRSPHSYTGTSAQYTEIYVHVIENSGGAAAVYSLLGDGA